MFYLFIVTDQHYFISFDCKSIPPIKVKLKEWRMGSCEERSTCNYSSYTPAWYHLDFWCISN